MIRLSTLGTLLFLTGLGIFLFTFLPVGVQELNFVTRRPPSTYQVPESPEQSVEFQNSPTMQDTVIVPKSFDFSLVIPKIGVNSLVFPNIDSGDPEEYLPVLKRGAAHALGSNLPDQAGPVYIFAHSTDSFYNITHYNAVFFLLNKLAVGDDIYVFYQNTRYHYAVAEKAVVEPDAIPDIVKAITTNTLILQTCWPPGTTMNRLLVYANLTQ